MKLPSAIIFIAFFFCVGVGNAMNLNEIDYGDFSGNPSSATPLSNTFNIGSYSVSGHVDFTAGDTYDLFQVSLEPDLKIKRIVWQSSKVQDQRVEPSPYFANGFISFPDSSHVALNASGFYTTMNLPESRTFSSDIDVNFFDLSHKIFGSAAGAPDFDWNTSSWIIVPNTGSAFEWTITFEVEKQLPVPEPSTTILLIIGVSLLAVSRRSLWRR